jgi:hypothetical protein
VARLDAGQLLRETLADLRERLSDAVTQTDATRRQYHALKIAAALRLLLLDERPLVTQASAPYRKIKVRFRIRPVQPDKDSEAWFANDLLDPSDAPSASLQVGGVQTWNRALTPREIKTQYERGVRRLGIEQTVGYQALLHQPIAKYSSTVITVGDAIRFLANIAGGVHHGTTRDEHEEKVDKVCATYQIQDLPSIHAAIFAVGRVVAHGLEPLEAKIADAEGPDSAD